MSRNKIVYLIGEGDHAIENKDILELGIYRKAREENRDKPIVGFSLELDTKTSQPLLDRNELPMNLLLFLNFIKSDGVPVYATDKRDFPETQRTQELEKTLRTCFDPNLVEEYRDVSRRSLNLRDDYAVAKIDSYFNGHEEGVFVHVCGLSHLNGLRKRLEKSGYKVNVVSLTNKEDLNFTKGDILYTLCDSIAHGVAAHDIEDMGTGLAKQINKKWPGSFERFKKYRRSQSFKPGEAWLDRENNPMIIYLATQENLQEAQSSLVNRSLRRLRQLTEKEHVVSVALPKIGCGYGKLEWENIKPLVVKHLSNANSRFFVYESRHQK